MIPIHPLAQSRIGGWRDGERLCDRRRCLTSSPHWAGGDGDRRVPARQPPCGRQRLALADLREAGITGEPLLVSVLNHDHAKCHDNERTKERPTWPAWIPRIPSADQGPSRKRGLSR
jgi:hypothetical protein